MTTPPNPDDSLVEEILINLAYESQLPPPNRSSVPELVREAKHQIQALFLEERKDEQTHTSADIDGNLEYWPNGVTVMSQLERLAELDHQIQLLKEGKDG